jgi:hypothetical protein
LKSLLWFRGLCFVALGLANPSCTVCMSVLRFSFTHYCFSLFLRSSIVYVHGGLSIVFADEVNLLVTARSGFVKVWLGLFGVSWLSHCSRQIWSWEEGLCARRTFTELPIRRARSFFWASVGSLGFGFSTRSLF